MKQLTIIANIIAKSDKVEFVKSELEKLIPVTKTEKGCIQYDLHQDNDNPTHFMFYENWVSHELWQIHMNAQPLKDYVTATEGCIEEFSVNEMSLIN